MTTTSRPGFSTTAAALALALALGLNLALFAAPSAQGNPIATPGFSLSAAEANRPILLDQNGARIVVLKGPHGTVRTGPSGASPTYVAYRLARPFELPAGYPTINVGGSTPHSGPARGPLRLDTLAKSALDAELAQSGGAAAVHLPRQTYLVESIASLVGSSSSAATQTWIASNAGAVATPAAASTGSSLGDTLKGWYNKGADTVASLDKRLSDLLASRFTLNPPKPVIVYGPKTRAKTATATAPAPAPAPFAAAEMLIPPAAGTIQPAPVPEPASLLVFAAAAAAAALRIRRRNGD